MLNACIPDVQPKYPRNPETYMHPRCTAETRLTVSSFWLPRGSLWAQAESPAGGRNAETLETPPGTLMCMGVSENRGTLFGGPCNKDPTI